VLAILGGAVEPLSTSRNDGGKNRRGKKGRGGGALGVDRVTTLTFEPSEDLCCLFRIFELLITCLIAVCCGVLQCVAECWSVLECVGVCFSVAKCSSW